MGKHKSKDDRSYDLEIKLRNLEEEKFENGWNWTI